MIPPSLVSIDALFQSQLEETLGIRGQRTNPPAADVSHVALTHDVGGGGYQGVGATAIKATTVAAAGLTSATRALLGKRGWTTGGIASMVETQEQNARILAAESNVIFDAAGAAAFAGKQIRVQFRLTNAVATGSVSMNINSYDKVLNGGLVIRFPLWTDCGWNGVIPWDCAIWSSIESLDGTAFPANTVFNYTVAAHLRAKGAQLPG